MSRENHGLLFSSSLEIPSRDINGSCASRKQTVLGPRDVGFCPSPDLSVINHIVKSHLS